MFVPAEHLGNRSWESSSQAKNAKSEEESPDPTCVSLGTYRVQRVWWGFWKEPVPVVGIIWQTSPSCPLCVWTWGSHTPCPGFCHLQEGTAALTQPEDISCSDVMIIFFFLRLGGSVSGASSHLLPMFACVPERGPSLILQSQQILLFSFSLQF